MSLACLAIVASSLVGWPDITVQPSRGDRAHSASYRNLASLDRPTDRTLDTIKRYDLSRQYRFGTDRVLSSLVKLARERPEPELVYALAELCWVEGRRLDKWRKTNAIDYYVDAVAYAHDFLTDPELVRPDGQRGSDPRYRTAMDLYNAGLERLLRAAQATGPITPEGSIKLKIRGQEQVFRVSLADSAWAVDDVDKLILASDYEVSGLISKTYHYGLGVPLIGVRLADGPAQEETRFYPPEMTFPLTAYLKPTSRLRDTEGDLNATRECTLELIDPVRTRTVCPPLLIPVESDFSTPLAYMWSRTDLNRYRWTGLLRPDQAIGRANLMLLRPYEPGKIPVVMVHGLISSPLAWIPMINELLNDPNVQQRYQFMLYMYPTGVPIPIASAMLRESLREAQRKYNPNGADPAFDQMVLLGHSMGGLLSHVMTLDSEDKLWQLNTDRPFKEIDGPKAVLDELQGYFFFKPLPFVKRVVFLATPHRGSDLSRSLVGRVSSGLIAYSDHINELLLKLVKENPDAFDKRRFRRLPTSIETLESISPNTPSILKAILMMKPQPDVVFHSIIGSLKPAGVDMTTDSVVNYGSAHLDGVESELMVRSDHGVQKDPEAIQEVRRILLKHAAALGGATPPSTVLAVPTGSR
ncbi:esterase/lipase family protein [Singulisphaera acidiphila]|uniref:AB hydrolase-1 domain-containing protein n=1 Tax=Singulisphaera acidiphila (strain ATCC BAA-1392 / DSM 18658 / VKM B-2454 / MOB10) TaxID=886293 RepID=L0DB26_SINAD|nr:hypothetical protein [Singulisphaera acidiphila]AGA26584.1 hypothetical protein Sinac_2266 [Singulisphaera acidiphila DSM 18658]